MYRSKRTTADHGTQSNIPPIDSQPRTQPHLSSLQIEESQPPKKQVRPTYVSTVVQPPKKQLKPTHDFTIAQPPKPQPIAKQLRGFTSNSNTLSTMPPMEVRPHTNGKQSFRFPAHLDPAYYSRTKSAEKPKAPISANKNSLDSLQPTKGLHISPPPLEPTNVIEKSTELSLPKTSMGRTEVLDVDVDEFDLSDVDPLQQGNEQANVEKPKSSRPSRSLKSKNAVPDYFDPKMDVWTIDAENKKRILSGSIQPRDIDHLDDNVRCIVAFNEFNQPINKAGEVLIRYLGWLAKSEKYCPITPKTWRQVNDIWKLDLIKRVRSKFVIPERAEFNRVITMHVSKSWRDYKHGLKKDYFHPEKLTKQQHFDKVPKGIRKDDWLVLVERWYSPDSKKLSEIGKNARTSQTHVHTCGSKSYANKKVDYIESEGKDPSHLEFFEMTHKKKNEEGFVDATSSSQFMEVAKSKVQELLDNSSPSKSRAEIENMVYDELMYADDNKPKRPVGFGFGVKQSQVFGLQGMCRREGFGSSASSANKSTELEVMKAKMSEMEKENQELRSKFDQIVAKADLRAEQSNQMMLRAIQALRSGKVSDEDFDAIQLMMSTPNSQVPSSVSGGTTNHIGLESHPSSSNS